MKDINYHIEENFISSEECQKLINEAKENLEYSDFIKIHSNRNILNSSSLGFHKLLQNSKEWKKLKSRIESENFLIYSCDKLNLDSSNFKLENFFNLISNKDRSFKEKTEKKIKEYNNLSLARIIITRFVRSLKRKFMFFKILGGKSSVELLYDYSISGKSYNREIHRDSDSRLIVFLLYLNEFDEKEKGGNLIFFKKKPDNFEEIVKIRPKAGKLVIFENNDASLHAVDPINHENTKRHFLYGGFTILSGNNPNLKSNHKSKTEFHLYE